MVFAFTAPAVFWLRWLGFDSDFARSAHYALPAVLRSSTSVASVSRHFYCPYYSLHFPFYRVSRHTFPRRLLYVSLPSFFTFSALSCCVLRCSGCVHALAQSGAFLPLRVLCVLRFTSFTRFAFCVLLFLAFVPFTRFGATFAALPLIVNVCVARLRSTRVPPFVLPYRCLLRSLRYCRWLRSHYIRVSHFCVTYVFFSFSLCPTTTHHYGYAVTVHRGCGSWFAHTLPHTHVWFTRTLVHAFAHVYVCAHRAGLRWLRFRTWFMLHFHVHVGFTVCARVYTLVSHTSHLVPTPLHYTHSLHLTHISTPGSRCWLGSTPHHTPPPLRLPWFTQSFTHYWLLHGFTHALVR